MTNNIDKKAKAFLEKLPVLTDKVLTNKNESDFSSDFITLKKLFDSFAIILFILNLSKSFKLLFLGCLVLKLFLVFVVVFSACGLYV